MRIGRGALIVLVFFAAGSSMCRAQTQDETDVRAVLQNVATNIGANGLRTLRYTASGMIAWFGQPFAAVSPRSSVAEHWPRLVATNYVMTIDYDSMSSKEEYVTAPPAFANAYPGLDLGGGAEEGSQSEPPLARGGGGIFDLKPRHIVQMVSGNFAWDVEGSGPVRQWEYYDGIDAADYRQLEIILTPHGFIKAALASGAHPRIIPHSGPTLVMITALSKYKVIATVQQNLVTDVETWISNPVAGDMRITQSYTRWKDFGTFKLFTDMSSRAFAGEQTTFKNENDTAQYRISDATVNLSIPAETFNVPTTVRDAHHTGTALTSRKLGAGTWLISSRPDNSVLVEFRDFVAVVEASANDERSQAVIAEVKRLVPNKPIRYVVNTHNHWDHSGGLRGFVAEGAEIVTHKLNVPYYQQVMFAAEFRLQPDTLAKREDGLGTRIIPRFVPVTSEPSMISDHDWGSSSSGRIMEFYPVGVGTPPAQNHAQDMIVAYLPDQKMLINTDLLNGNPAVDDSKIPTTSSERVVALSHIQNYKGVVSLDQLIRRYNLSVAWHVPIHGEPVSQETFLRILGNAVALDSHGPLILAPVGDGSALKRP